MEEKNNIKYERVLVTPKLAEELLAKNSKNRKIRANVVDAYARDMAEERWESNNPTPISIWEDGTLADGQHRLLAICKIDKPMFMTLAKVPNGTSMFDVQAARSTADISKMQRGYNIRLTLSGAVKLWLEVTKFGTCGTKLTKNEILDAYEKERDLWDSIYEATVTSSSAISKKAGCVVAARAAFKCGVPIETIESFFKTVNSGFSKTEYENAAILARNFLIDSKPHMRCDAKKSWGYMEEYINLYSQKSTRRRQITLPTWHYSKILGEIKA